MSKSQGEHQLIKLIQSWRPRHSMFEEITEQGFFHAATRSSMEFQGSPRSLHESPRAYMNFGMDIPRPSVKTCKKQATHYASKEFWSSYFIWEKHRNDDNDDNNDDDNDDDDDDRFLGGYWWGGSIYIYIQNILISCHVMLYYVIVCYLMWRVQQFNRTSSAMRSYRLKPEAAP